MVSAARPLAVALAEVPVATDAPACPAAAGVPRADVVTSGSTTAPRGISALICRTSEATRSCGALTTIAFPAGKPSNWATVREITASTPPIPTVPNPATRSDRSVFPATVTVPPRGSLSCLPMV